MNNLPITCYISTKGRYDSTLSLSMLSIATQTLLPKCFILYDDNDEPRDLREDFKYKSIFALFDRNNIKWKIIFGEKKGQIYNHQKALEQSNTDFIFRCDDDCILESNVLETLYSNMKEDVGATSCAILNPFHKIDDFKDFYPCNKINTIKVFSNAQWFSNFGKKEVEHIYSCFLYRKSAAKNYNLSLSRVGFREETLFTNQILQNKYKLIIDSNAIIWHFSEPAGGIRDDQKQELYDADEAIFDEYLNTIRDNKPTKTFILKEGIGDHFAFKEVYDSYKKLLYDKYNVNIYCSCPEIFWNEDAYIFSLGEAYKKFGEKEVDKYSVYSLLTKNAISKRIMNLQKGYEELYFSEFIKNENK